MSRQHTALQIGAKGSRLPAGFVARGQLLRRGKGRIAWYMAAQEEGAVARSSGRPLVSPVDQPASEPAAPRSWSRK
jgi:hypothetical protein